MFRLLDKPARAQIGQCVIGGHRRQSGHATTAYGHHNLAAGSGMLHISAELIVQLTHADLAFERWLMWRHQTQSRRYIARVKRPRAALQSAADRGRKPVHG